jgi:hypothetical protein
LWRRLITRVVSTGYDRNRTESHVKLHPILSFLLACTAMLAARIRGHAIVKLQAGAEKRRKCPT